MSLAAPLNVSEKRKSSTRLDIVTAMLGPAKEIPKGTPRDSLSPLDDIAREGFSQSNSMEMLSNAFSDEPAASRGRKQTREEPPPQRQDHHEVATAPAPLTTCSPRSALKRNSRPKDLHLTKSNGATTTSAESLRSVISHGHTVPTPPPAPPAKSRKRIGLVMGNKPSTLQAETLATGQDGHAVASTDASSPKMKYMNRKVSKNLFKRNDSGHGNHTTDTTLSASDLKLLNGAKDSESPVDPFVTSQPGTQSPPASLHSGSTATLVHHTNGTEDSNLDSANTLTQDSMNETGSSDDADDEAPPVPVHSSPLRSPMLPSPSRLPEDSPSKYGILDRGMTPEMVVPEIQISRARRRSSGLEIFNEAKTLQSTTNYFNGVSVQRRRADSAARSTDQTNGTSTTYTSSQPSTNTTNTSASTRVPGHFFKPSGHAYSHPLDVSQLRCYRGHQRFHISRNRYAPIECAVCHADEVDDHYSCTWCAIRMCGFCRKDFAQRGMTALRERIKEAEMGGSPNSSQESITVQGYTTYI